MVTTTLKNADSWQLLNVTHCLIHKVILIDQCPHCSYAFVDWNRYIFRCCPHCGSKWKSVQFPTVQLPMNQLVTFSPEQLDSLFDTMLFTLRPKDLMFRRLQGIELSVAETARQIQIAYELMTNSQLRHEWIERVEASNPYHFTPSIEGRTIKDIFERNSQNFQQQKHCHTAGIDIAIPSLTSHLTHRRNKFQKRGIPYQHHLGIKEVSFILGITTTDVMQLVEDQLMQPLDATAILRDLFFNVEDITRLLDDINEHAHLIEYDNGLKKLIDFLPMLRFFGMSQGKFLSILSSLAGTYYRTETKQHWLSLFINYENMIYTLENRYLDLLPEHVDKQDFQSIYGLSNEQMQNLMKNSDLHYSNWQRTKQCIKKNVIKDFCSSFIVLNRIAKLKSKNVHVFAKELAEMGIYPVQILTGTRDVFLYSIYDKDDVFSKS